MNIKIISIVSSLSVLLFFVSILSVVKDKGDYHYLKTRLETTKSYTIDVINTMPEDDFGFQPSEELRSFKALACHTIYSIEWNMELMKEKPIKWEPGDENRYSKEELLNYANEQFISLQTFIDNVKENPELTDKIIDVLNHNAHHRGQMVTYLRLKDIVPPDYK